MKEFYSNGKLLITGEYLVLDGAEAFALPTVFGQSMKVVAIEEKYVYWTCYDADNTVWMDEKISVKEILSDHVVQGSNYLATLVSVLRAAHQQNNQVLTEEGGFRVEAKLTFPRLWGLGTSSTWINNVAQWFNCNPYQLLRESFGGSGYDIACAKHNHPILYKKEHLDQPLVCEVDFYPPFLDKLYFVYLNQKQNSKEGIKKYKENRNNITDEIEKVSTISKAIWQTDSLVEFTYLLQKHESIVEKIIQQLCVQQQLFSDFSGTIKSLGAWGGDFVLVVSEDDPVNYFLSKGYTTILKYSEMIKQL